MKHLTLFLALGLFLVGLNFQSCGFAADAEEAEKYVDEWYDNLKAKDYDALMAMVDEEGLEANSEEEWRTVLQQKEALGEIKSIEKDVGFSANSSDDVTTVTLDYTVEYDLVTIYERIKMVKRGEEYKVLSYQYNEDKSRLENL